MRSALLRSILYVDQELIVLNKWRGMVVQGAKNSLASNLEYLKLDEDDDPRIVHRLDKLTTGALVVARRPEGASRLAALFARQEVSKVYWAVTQGVPNPPLGRIVTSATENPDGPVAGTTDYELLAHTELHTALIQFQPLTGKQHQIRIHAAEALGCPIIGDTKYGKPVSPWINTQLMHKLGHRATGKTSLHLHALEISFPSVDGNMLQIMAPVPSWFRRSLHALDLAKPLSTLPITKETPFAKTPRDSQRRKKPKRQRRGDGK